MLILSQVSQVNLSVLGGSINIPPVLYFTMQPVLLCQTLTHSHFSSYADVYRLCEFSALGDDYKVFQVSLSVLGGSIN